MSDGQAAAALWGRDFEELGVVGSRSVGEFAAIAITRGRHKKAYRYEDANEDAVAVVAGAEATLVVCADGHNGMLAPETAVQAVLDHFGPAPPAELSDKAWLELFGAVNETVIARKGIGSPQPASNTVLIAALVTPDHVSWASLGDSALLLARAGEARGTQLNKEAMRFAGYPMNGRALKRTVQRGQARREPDQWVVAVTDGLSEFVTPRRPADVVPALLGGTPEDAARAIVDAACEAGAGDNVAVAALAPPFA